MSFVRETEATASAEHVFWPFDLSDIQMQSSPFPFFGKEHALNPEVGGALLEWLEDAPHWKPHVGGFYDLDDFSLLKARALPERLHCLRSRETLSWLRHRVGSLFGTALTENVDVDALRMRPTDKVGIHTDYRPGRETHRLIFYVTPEWRPEFGGVLLFFEEPSHEGLRIGFPPLNLLAIGFEISERSHHAVSPMVKGVRYSLVYSFYATAPPAG
jgi:Rps23 Pro-64 3,4-dihydroxylase Tpa1-like proline 4-hydroxylase